MRTYSILLIVALLFFTSCKDDPPPLTPDLVTSVKAYDLDNNGNSSDIRVDFIVENNLNVSEYRIMVIPTSASNIFDQSVAVSIPRENFLSIFPESFKTEYSIPRLPSTLPDVNGALIINGVEYVVAILVIGNGNFQLSEFSIPFTLKDQGIYAGYYEGVFTQEVIINTGGSLCELSFGPFDMKTTIMGTQQDNYSGTLICTNCPIRGDDQGLISFIISSNMISNFIFNQTILCYSEFILCSSCVIFVDPCPGNFTGQGIATSELSLSIDLAGDDCFGFSEITLILTRQ